MGVPLKQKPVKLVASLIYGEDVHRRYAEDMLEAAYGPLGEPRAFLPFGYTDYYLEEFGPGLQRRLVCFRNLVALESLPEIKLATNRFEDRSRKDGKRRVNIDPGYLTEAKLVLLTTKDYSHRIYVGKSIFAESTLCFRKGTFVAWPWTYPDYASPEIVSYFNRVRENYMKETRGKEKRTCS
jgi:hypothetical protein